MGPIDDFFARNGIGLPPKKKTFYQKHKGTIELLIALGIVIVLAIGFIVIFNIPVLLSK